MMRKLAASLLILVALCEGASAQCNGVFGAGEFCGNPTGSAAPPKPIRGASGNTLTPGITWSGLQAIVPAATLSAGQSALTVTATQPSTPTQAQNAITATITSAGSVAQRNRAFRVNYLAGYTGTEASLALSVSNAAAGAASTLVPASGTNTTLGNFGLHGDANGTTAGLNLGVGGTASGGNVNAGLVGAAQAAKNSAVNIGVVGSAINTGSSPVMVGGWFSLNQTVTPSVSAGLIAGNGSQALPVALFQVNGVTKVTVSSVGDVLAASGTASTSTATGALVVTGGVGISGNAYAAEFNNVIITQPATVATLTIANNKTLTANNSLTLGGTDGKSLTLTTGLTVTTNDGTIAFGAASKTLTVNNNIGLSGTDGKTLTTNASLTLAGTDAKSLTLTTGLTVSGNDGTLSFGGASKTLTVNKSITLDGTDSTTMTFPSVSATIPRVVASGAKALATSSISSGACTSAQTDTATGTLSTDAVEMNFNTDPTAITGFSANTSGMLTIIPYPTADTINFKVCNNTASSITPGAVTINWRVVR